MNLEDTWSNCIKMWRWVAKKWDGENHYNVRQLKKQWLQRNDFEGIQCDCFFCDYRSSCERCPAVAIDDKFDCQSIDKGYAFDLYPKKFYNKIKYLNTKRKKQNAKTKAK